MEDKLESTTSTLVKTIPETLNDKPIDPLQSGIVQSNDDERVFVITEDRKLGFVSVVFVIINTMIGTGIFSTPAGVYRAVNSVGASFMMWTAGAILTLSGYFPRLR